MPFTFLKIPEDPLFGLQADFLKDPRKEKVNLGIGTYQTNEGKLYLFSSVFEAEKKLLEEKQPKRYLPIDGDSLFLKEASSLLLEGALFDEKTLFKAQSVGGTSALSLGANLSREGGIDTIYLPDPTWANHKPIFLAANLKTLSYPYLDEKKSLVFEKMVDTLKAQNTPSLVLLHASSHNPTGIDLSSDQMDHLLKTLEKKGHIPFFDCAYQGIKTSLSEDALFIQKALRANIPFLVAYSFSKNMGLYGERLGFLLGCLPKSESSLNALSNLKKWIRSTYSNPPSHGQKIATKVLTDPSLKALWIAELAQISLRIKETRASFAVKMESYGIDSFNDLKEQSGFFSLSPLSQENVLYLREKWAVYLPLSGRINVCGITPSNIDYIAHAIADSFKR